MEYTPPLRVLRLQKAAVGELLLYPLLHESSTVALKCVDAEQNDEFVAILGPVFGEAGVPYLRDVDPETVVSFGQSFRIRLPVDSADWSMSEPPPKMQCLAVSGDKVFFRVNGSRRASSWAPWLVDAATGIVDHKPHSIVAYAARWSLMVPDAPNPDRIILSVEPAVQKKEKT